MIPDNQKKDNEIIVSGTTEIETLKDKVLEMEEKLSEVYKTHEVELANMNAENGVCK